MPNCPAAAKTDADVGVAAERAFFHVAIADAGVEQDLAQRREIGVSLFGRAHVGLGDDFGERRAAPVVVDVGLGGGLRETFVKIFGGVFLDVETRDTDAFFNAGDFDFDVADGGEWELELGNLISLGKVGVEIIFAGEARMFVNGAVEGEGCAGRHLDDALVQDRQRAGQAEADRAGVGVGSVAEARGAGAEDFRFGQELGVDFEADDGLVLGQHLRRNRRFRCTFSHSEVRL